ncbi:hypothetical protein AB0B78_00500 [Streptomyces sp. NPDC040724]|uniref:hypothetical protein n=1 Tax=unclassified Streptomyces TaxID=2593676 RepID=UPI003401ECA4
MIPSVDRAREALRSGLPPAEAYAALAVGADFRQTALVVCDALGIPRADVEDRLRGSEELWSDFAPGDEELLGELLDLAAVFDVDVTLDEPGEHIRGLMQRATDALGGIASGVAFGIGRKLDTGRLPAAYAVLVGLPVHEGGDPVRYRAELSTAGELLAAWLPPEDEAAAALVREARERCARRDTGSRAR